MSKPDAQRLCLSCGLCCSGAFFGRIDLESNEDPSRMVDRGLLIEQSADNKRFFMRLPCAALENNRCSSYDCRPAICHSYRCRLLKRLDRQGCTLAQAQSAVGQAKELISRLTHQIQKEFPELAKLSMLAACDVIAERFAALDGPERIKFGQTHQKFYLAHAAYACHIEEHFHRQNDGSIGPVEPALERAKSELG